MKFSAFNYFFPIWVAIAFWLGYTDRVSWWTILLIVLYGFKITQKTS